MSLDQVIENFIWRIEAITPDEPLPDQGFRYYDDEDFDPDEGDVARVVQVQWISSDENTGTTDLQGREAVHEFLVSVGYSVSYKERLLGKIIAKDRHQLCKTLRDDRLWKGYNDSNTTTDIKLWSRDRVRDEIDRSETHTWYYRAIWQCTIRESES